uniref:DUF4206 domain-containing protein n=1 Tax=Mesocestoides corti TaxID=53468 RepID=A0A5K3G7E7_MESCO
TFQRSPGKSSFLLSRLVSQHSTWSISVNQVQFSFMRRCAQQQQQHKLQRYHQQNDSSPALAQLHEISSGFCQCCTRHACLSYCSLCELGVSNDPLTISFQETFDQNAA